jgi:hypothetical protein
MLLNSYDNLISIETFFTCLGGDAGTSKVMSSRLY